MIKALGLWSVKFVSFDISFISYLFKENEPVTSKLPVANCFCVRLSPHLVLPVLWVFDLEVEPKVPEPEVIVPLTTNELVTLEQPLYS
mgnify:CR=1 FL=1